MSAGLIKRLDAFVCEESGRGYRVEPTPNPAWEEIKAAVRRLDRHCYPFVWLHAGADAADDDVPFVSVMGGEGAYHIEAFPVGRHVVYDDGAGDEAEVEVWTSDQGASAPASRVCRDVEVVLGALRHLYETGDFDPRVRWKVS